MNLHAEVISIGDELLAGNIINGNAAFISRKLHELGIDVTRQISLPDESSALSEGLSESMSCAPLVIATGGLGPTLDDFTRQVAAELFDTPMVVNEELKSFLLGKYGNHASIENQSTQPKKALLFRNAQGTAPGLALSSGQSTLILLPGVPYEMEALLTEQVIPFIQTNFQLAERRYETSLHFFHLNESSVDPLLREIKEEYPELHIGIYPRNGLVSVNLSGKVSEVDKAKERISTVFEDHFFDAADGKVETAVHQLFIAKNLKLAMAESCTGGAMSSRLTAIPGASHYFQGSLVVYSNGWKESLLGVPAHLIQEKGAVSEEVALKMAEAVLEKMTVDCAVAITGIAGPDGGTPEKPVGTVFAAIKRKSAPPKVLKLMIHGSRKTIIERATNIVFGELYHYCL
ncbi:MAG: nicotinamide-nucleotide amidohydrolase family protein [Parachlamydiaceae bacterium]